MQRREWDRADAVLISSLAALTPDGNTRIWLRIGNILHYTQGPPQLSVIIPAPFTWDGKPGTCIPEGMSRHNGNFRGPVILVRSQCKHSSVDHPSRWLWDAWCAMHHRLSSHSRTLVSVRVSRSGVRAFKNRCAMQVFYVKVVKGKATNGELQARTR
jgi:hypothetical protein